MKPFGAVSEGPLTERKVLWAINSVVDLLRIAVPVVITGKILCSEACLRRLKWDEEELDDIWTPWKKWMKGLEERPQLSIPCSFVNRGVKKNHPPCFFWSKQAGHFSSNLCAGILYYCTSSPEPDCRKVKDCTREPINSRTLSRVMNHVKGALQGHPVDEYDCWVDSTAVLYWIKGLWGTEPRPFRRWGIYSGTTFQLVTILVTREAEAWNPLRWESCGFKGQVG